MLKSKLAMGLLAFALAGAPTLEQPMASDITQDLSVITALTLNLTRFTEWPQSVVAKEANLRLCVLGDNVLQQAFEQIADMPVGPRKLQVIPLLRIKNLGQCHALFISGLDRSTVVQLINDIKNQPILTVSADEDHFTEDAGMVAFKIVAEKVNLEINLGAVKLSGMEINSRVLKLAKIVNP